MDVKEFIGKWGSECAKLLLSYNTRTTTVVEVQAEIDRMVSDLDGMLQEEAKRL